MVNLERAGAIDGHSMQVVTQPGNQMHAIAIPAAGSTNSHKVTITHVNMTRHAALPLLLVVMRPCSGLHNACAIWP
jgi:hypothetical protein